MKRRDFSCAQGCHVEVTLDLIDGKWKGVILYHLQAGRLRFGELRKKMPGITQRMLTKQLRALEDDDLITRTVFAEVPPRVEYALSETGVLLRPVIDALKSWGEQHRARQAGDTAIPVAGAGAAHKKTEAANPAASVAIDVDIDLDIDLGRVA